MSGTAERAEALREAKRQEAHHSRLVMRGSSWYRGRVANAMMIAGFLSMVALIFVRSWPVVFGWVGLVVLQLVLSNIPSRIVVGSDAVSARWLFRHRRVPLAAIRDIEQTKRSVRLVLDEGALDLPLDVTGLDGANEVSTLAARIARARDSDEQPMATFDLSALDRNELPVSTWIERLRALATRAESFRDEPPPPQTLWAALEDGRLEVRRRVGAAIALGPNLDEPGRVRMRLVAESIVDDAPREAIRAAAEEDKASLAHAVEKVG